MLKDLSLSLSVHVDDDLDYKYDILGHGNQKLLHPMKQDHRCMKGLIFYVDVLICCISFVKYNIVQFGRGSKFLKLLLQKM